jgi:VWFA-related protein
MSWLRGVNGHRRTATMAGAALTLVCALTSPEFLTARTSTSNLHVTTRLVEVNVVVHDKNGAPVTGLKQKDFTVEDNGKKQRVSVFSVTSSQKPESTAKPLAPNVFSNHVSRLGSTPVSATAILLDGRGTEFGDQAYAREQLIRLFHQLRPSDRVALYALGRHLSVIQDFTSSPSPLIAALRQYQGQPTAPSSPSSQPQTELQAMLGQSGDLAGRLSNGLLDMTNLPPPEWADMFLVLHSIQAIAQHFSGLPGRKSLIWVTGAVPLPQELYDLHSLSLPHIGVAENYALEEEVQNTMQALNQADVGIYPVNARGLFAGPAYSARASRANRDVVEDLIGMYDPTQGMIYWASHTGGQAFHDNNDLSSAIRKAMDDCDLTYTLSYRPNNARWDGEYRDIKVRVDRKHVRVRYRLGYYATSEKAVRTSNPLAELQSAGKSPLDYAGIGLTVRVLPIGNPAARQFRAEIDVSSRGIAFQSVNGRNKASFEVWAGQFSQQGRLLRGMSNNVSVDLKPDEYRQILHAGGFQIKLEDKANPNAWQLRIAVRDTATGTLGSVRIPIHNLLSTGGDAGK